MREKIAYVDGFAKCLEDNGIDPDQFFKEASRSEDRKLQKIAREALSVIDYAVGGSRQKEAALLGKTLADSSSWLKELYQTAKHNTKDMAAASKSLGGGGKIVGGSRPSTYGDGIFERMATIQPEKTIRHAGTPIGVKEVPVGLGSKEGLRAAKQYSVGRSVVRPSRAMHNIRKNTDADIAQAKDILSEQELNLMEGLRDTNFAGKMRRPYYDSDAVADLWANPRTRSSL